VTGTLGSIARWTAGAAAVCLLGAAPAEAQLGALLSPGPLARAHASLEGASNCEKCHERGRRVTAARCLTCHAPIAQRIAQKKGVHRNVKDECVTCHADHAGVDGELRPFDQARFDHAVEAGFALAGKHAPVAAKCAMCHKTRSFVTASPSCATCHEDKHKGALGSGCERCHSVDVAFAASSRAFDHSRAAFALTGAHRTVACASCHRTPNYKVAKFSTCAGCHATPHAPKVSTACTTCHATESWRTRTFDHARTAYPLVGRHATADCAGCHKAPAAKVKPAAGTCATCHADPHKGNFKQDCKSCHTEHGFAGAKFDHLAATGYALTDRHAAVSCRACHTGLSPPRTVTAKLALDYRGLKTTCASCHADPHGSELGAGCERCHSVKTFKVASFAHAGRQELFTGQHARVACSGCHVPPARTGPKAVIARFAAAPTACASCHQDPHVGQVGTDCATCHSVAAIRFAADRFSHDRTKYPLVGRHQPLACAACHKPAVLASPAGNRTATRFTGIGTACATCHQDIHLGQVGATCETCHSASSFKVMAYTHRRPPRDFFVGRHVSATCRACHAPVTREFPAGHGTAVDFTVGTACTACHADPHKGSLGSDCARCHRPEPLSTVHRPFAPEPQARWQ
jgi:hypothetical protein